MKLNTLFLLSVLFAMAAGSLPAGQFEHKAACAVPGKFAGWPANNGAWSWGDEILVGFMFGDYVAQSSFHNMDFATEKHNLARSTDGGQTWTLQGPSNTSGSGTIMPPPGGINFAHPDFAMRCFQVGAEGVFYYSYDRGYNWHGPYSFGNLKQQSELASYWHLSLRTDYIVNGPNDCMIFMSVRPYNQPNGSLTRPWDRTFMARTTDGGASFQFVSWLVPAEDMNRSVMSSSVRLSETQLVSAIRRRAVPDDVCWIDLYASNDNGSTWSFRSKVTHVDDQHNGNPPALAVLDDGRLCCVYGNRNSRKMYARFSADQGVTWGDPVVFRDDFYPQEPMTNYAPDFGYPRLVKRPDGKLVALYYWQTYDYFMQNTSGIEATIWNWTCWPPLLGDTDGDCRVNLEDFANLASEWMDCGRFPESACVDP